MTRTKLRVLCAFLVGVAALSAPAPSGAGASPDYTYVTMSDGVQIAVAVSYPAALNDPGAATHNWPALLVMDGYDGGAGAYNPATYGRNKYVVIHASIRGTGCSGGKFNLFDRRSALDGKEIIDEWIPAQPWSNGRVGVIGHSYPGLTGFLIASTSPTNLEAVAVSGLIDDLYRGIVYPGGVPNYGFPAVWTVGYRPAYELAGNASRYQNETSSGDPTCAANVASRPPSDPLDNPVANGLNTQDSQWWASHALTTYVRGIDAPIHITQQWQDEQTGPRGGNVLFERMPDGLPKRLQLTNGVHSTTGIAQTDRNNWLDCWIITRAANPNAACGDDQWGHGIDDPSTRVQVHFETAPGTTNAPLVGADWPLPQTTWTRYYLRASGALTTAPGGSAEAATSYVSASAGRQTTATTGGLVPTGGRAGELTFVAGPDEATYTLGFDEPTAIAGPIQLSLTASSTAPDTDFFVDILDRNKATGQLQYLQRGMQRASHRAINTALSDYVKGQNAAAGTMYRAWHPHTNPQPIVPMQEYRYEIEVFPVGHYFREGHEMVVKVHAPPPVDPLSIYFWLSGQPTAVNTIIQRNGASSILLPVVPTPPVTQGAPACGAQIAIPCFKPVA